MNPRWFFAPYPPLGGLGRGLALLVLAVCVFGVTGSVVAQPESPSDNAADEADANKTDADKVELTANPEDPEVAGWKAALVDGSREDRRRAAVDTRSLSGELKLGLLPTMIELLRTERDGQIRLALLDTVTDMGPDAAAAVPALADAMRGRFGNGRTEQRHQDYRAAFALGSIGPAAVEELRKLLGEEQENIRAEAAMALGHIGSDAAAAIPDLIERLADDRERVREDAAVALGRIGEQAVPRLLAAFEGAAPKVRAGVIAALNQMESSLLSDDAVTGAVKVALRDDETEVRAVAVGLLPKLRLSRQEIRTRLMGHLVDAEEAVRTAVVNSLIEHPELLSGSDSELAEALVDPNPDVAWDAAFLMQSTGITAFDRLLEAARDDRGRIDQLAKAIALLGPAVTQRLYTALEDADPRVRGCAALALGQMRPVAGESVERLTLLLREADPAQRPVIVNAVALLESRAGDAVGEVRQLLGDSDDSDDIEAPVKRQIIQILLAAAPHDQALVNDLQTALADSDPAVKREAIFALKSLGPVASSSISRVVEQLDNADSGVRLAAAEMIASHGEAASQAVPRLTELLNESSPETRVVFLGILGQLGAASMPAYPSLLTHLESDNADVRSAALQAVASVESDPDKIQAYLFNGLRDASPIVREQAYTSIRRMGRASARLLPSLIPLLADENADEPVGRLLSRFERSVTNARFLPALAELIEHDNVKVRLQAIRFIGLAGGEAADLLPRLEPLASDENEKIREEAATAISKINGQDTSADGD